MADRRRTKIEPKAPEEVEVTEDVTVMDQVPWEEVLRKQVKMQVVVAMQHFRQEIEQRITDLEMLVGQPAGAVQFFDRTDLPQRVPTTYEEDDTPEYVQAHKDNDGIPWYGG